MKEEEIIKLKHMLASCNTNDVNLAGILIKERVLNISDEQLEILFELYTYAVRNKGKNIRSFDLRDLLTGTVNDQKSNLYEWPLIGSTMIKDITRIGEIKFTNNND